MDEAASRVTRYNLVILSTNDSIEMEMNLR